MKSAANTLVDFWLVQRRCSLINQGLALTFHGHHHVLLDQKNATMILIARETLNVVTTVVGRSASQPNTPHRLMPPKEGVHRIRQIKDVQAQFKMNVHVILTVMWMMVTSVALTGVDDCAGRKLNRHVSKESTLPS